MYIHESWRKLEERIIIFGLKLSHVPGEIGHGFLLVRTVIDTVIRILSRDRNLTQGIEEKEVKISFRNARAKCCSAN